MNKCGVRAKDEHNFFPSSSAHIILVITVVYHFETNYIYNFLPLLDVRQ